VDELRKFVNEMRSTSSLNEKKQIIETYKQNTFIMQIVEYTYNPYKKYHVTSKNCKKLNHLFTESPPVTIFKLLDQLNNRTFTGHDAIKMVNGFIKKHESYMDLIFGILDKNIEIRANASVFNKIIPNLIPTFDVALAVKYEEKFCDFETEEWFASRKLDGVRCIVRKEAGVVRAFSRVGNEFTTLQQVLIVVENLSFDNFVLDGEICLLDDKGNDDFQGIMKQIKRKDHTIQKPQFIVFDYLTLQEFDSKKSQRFFSERHESLNILLKDLTDNCSNFLKILEQRKIGSTKELVEMNMWAEDSGYEGVMLRKNVGYEGKRSKHLLKCKKFSDAEYVVQLVVSDNMRFIEAGKDIERETLSHVIIIHKGHEVRVGSGFSKQQREKYHHYPELLLGKTITVQYFEETLNQEGGVSLRFPTVKHIFENGRNV